MNFSITKSYPYLLLSCIVIVLGTACSGPAHDQGPLAYIKEHNGKEIKYAITADNFIHNFEKVAVTNQAHDTLFFIPKRTNEILSFPCSSCHTTDLNKMNSQDPLEKKAHWQIKLNHATKGDITCVTCHSSINLEQLTLISNKKISLNQSQKLCAQCHSTQSNDWLGGAHGKQLGSWLPPRVSNTCVSCHNPHSPAFEKRWPSRLNTVKIKELDPK